MLAVWRGACSFRGESSVRSWVIAIARRQTRDRLRGRRLRVVDDAFLADHPDSGPGPEVTALDRAELAEVRAACPPGTAPVVPGYGLRLAFQKGHLAGKFGGRNWVRTSDPSLVSKVCIVAGGCWKWPDMPSSCGDRG